MTAALLENPTTVTNELNHSCTSQCPNPCPYTSQVAVPMPEMTTEQ